LAEKYRNCILVYSFYKSWVTPVKKKSEGTLDDSDPTILAWLIKDFFWCSVQNLPYECTTYLKGWGLDTLIFNAYLDYGSV
jgi:hypothetical protein